jgi:hypothetical protein
VTDRIENDASDQLSSFATPANLNVSTPTGVGQISALQTVEGAGPHSIQLTVRLNF